MARRFRAMTCFPRGWSISSRPLTSRTRRMGLQDPRRHPFNSPLLYTGTTPPRAFLAVIFLTPAEPSWRAASPTTQARRLPQSTVRATSETRATPPTTVVTDSAVAPITHVCSKASTDILARGLDGPPRGTAKSAHGRVELDQWFRKTPMFLTRSGWHAPRMGPL